MYRRPGEHVERIPPLAVEQQVPGEPLDLIRPYR